MGRKHKMPTRKWVLIACDQNLLVAAPAIAADDDGTRSPVNSIDDRRKTEQKWPKREGKKIASTNSADWPSSLGLNSVYRLSAS